MKGKLKLSLKIILTAAISLFAGVCFVGLQPALNAKKEIPAHAVATIDGEDYSALLGGDVVLSVEKVAVDENKENYSNQITAPNAEKFYIRDGSGEKEIYFQDIYQDNKTKQVVEDGQFVMLNNKNVAGVYKNPDIDQAEAVIISLGQYVYYNETIRSVPATLTDTDRDEIENNTSLGQQVKEDKKDTNYAQMTFLSVNLSHNGKAVSGLSYRNIDTADGSRFYDFMYMITEDGIKDIEGHYSLTTNYIKGGVEYTADFEFYLVCESTYTRTKTVDGQTYTSSPQLGWSENGEFSEKPAETDGSVHYYEGKDGLNNNSGTNTSTISYPTITYDYTKYQMSYTLTANRNITTYSYMYSYKNASEAIMTCSIDGVIKDEKQFPLNNYSQDLKLVTIVFTEQGNYNISFKYLYTGADKANAPTMDKLKIDNKKLAIHGVDLNYSKQDYTGAQFRKFNFATNTCANVSLIIPNGYHQTEDNIEKYKNNALGFMYTVNDANLNVATSRKVRVGDVIIADEKDGAAEYAVKDRTEDTLQNRKFADNAAISSFVSSVLDKTKYEDIDISEEGYFYDNNEIDLNICNFEFVKTNQGSMWLSYTDKILETKENENVSDSKSFYFYSRNTITENSLVTTDSGLKSTAKPYNNQTSFNKVGYYLVFIKIDPKSDTTATGGGTDDYWQVYAFQYMSDTIDIQVKTEPKDTTKEGIDIGAGKYTTENVTISWKEPETFETKIVGKYYKITNQNASREQLLATSGTELIKNVETNKSQVLGGDVNAGQFAKYLIKLERAGKSATYKMFTIDRQPISGVAAYAIKTRATSSAVYYEYATKNGEPIQILNGITNSYSTLSWTPKGSGARITATYSYTPFVSDSSITPTFVNSNEFTGITTTYKLGTTINNCELAEVTSRANVGYDSVLFGQGIYVFTLIDEAGNATKYMLVIDNTEAYIQINDGTNTEILPNGAYRLYGDDVTYTTGTHKAIKLSTAEGDEINAIIPDILDENLINYKDAKGIAYYTGDSSANINAMNKLFSEFNEKNYLIVENQKVVAYANASIDTECSSTNPGGYKTIEFNRENLGGATSLIRTLYVVGANMLYSASYNDTTPNQSISYIKVEINKDNARGMVYYGNTSFDIGSIPEDGESSSNVVRLQTGSDNLDEEENVKTSGLGNIKEGAHASKDKYFAFTWLVGEDKFTVTKLTYQYYSLNLKSFSEDKYFYTTNAATDLKTLVDGANKDTNIVLQDGRGFFLIGNEYNGTTKDGLYVFTRYYKYDPDKVEDYINGNPVDYGDDTYSLTYYFIVDRNGIHDITNDIGNNIEIGLLNETTGVSGDKFSLISTKPETFKFDNNNDGIFDINEQYYLYFSTNRVPAVLKIPTGKYFDGTNSSYGYYAGQLKISVYYQDIYGQLSNNSDKPYKLLDIDIPNSTNGYYTINFVEQIPIWEDNIVNQMIANTKDGKSWLHLQGRYVVIIEDNVETSSKITNKKILGFNIIEEKYPEAEIKIGGTDDASKMTKVIANNDANGNFSVMTNQEYVRVELPLYDSSNVLAQVDDQYILVKQNFNNQGEQEYIKSEYGNDFVGKLETDSETGKRYVKLDTLLRDKNGDILTENFSKPLYYTVTIRYQIGTSANKELYKDCYVYYTYENGVAVKNYYYYSTYTITIDRLAPTDNVESLRKNDNLIQNGYVQAEFESDYYEESQMYFTYQYSDYFNFGKNLSDIYMFRVNQNTPFNKSDVDALYVSSSSYSKEEIETLSLNLPIVSFGEFRYVDLSKSANPNFRNIFGDAQGYYQVLEIDKAGNMTQYVVYYSNSTEEYLKMPVKYQSTIGEMVGDNEEFNIGFNSSTSTIDLFEIESNGDVTNSGDYFFYISLKDVNNVLQDNWQPLSFVTNLATSYSGENSISKQIINAIGTRKGSYELIILPRIGQAYKLGISVYSEDDKVDLNIEKLIEKHNGKYYINLRGANVYNNNNMFYAKEITITSKTEGETDAETKRYICKIENGQYNYYWDNGTPADLTDDVLVTGAMLECKANTTYKLGIIDVFGDSLFTRFNTEGKEFYSINFEDFGKFYIDEQGHYYAYSDAKITYDGIFEVANINISVNGSSDGITIEDYVKNENNIITINKIYNAETGVGGILNVEIKFKESDGTEDRTFNITIDTRTNNVSLKDYNTGDNKTLKLFNNINFASDIQNLKQYKSQDVTSGIMNLSWINENKENYSYSYQLFELKKDAILTDGLVQEIELTNTNYVIDTQEDSYGVYWFVINVMSPDGELLGNKIYAFEVQAVNNNLYYVKNKDGLAINPNSTFNVSDIKALISAEIQFKYGSLTGEVDNIFISKLPTTNLPLYITNHKLDVVLTENVTSNLRIAALGNNQTLIIYEIDATTYQLYFGILQIAEKSKLVTKENINGVGIGETEFVTFVNETNPTCTLNAQRTQDLTNILAKNVLLLDVFYNGEKVKTVEYKENIGFAILGNGSYSFSIRDLAGNNHKFENGTKEVEVLVLREVVVTLNDQAPIENAYYNGEVSLKVYAATKYVTGSISVTAKRNGNPYQVSTSNPYIFKDYGTYVVNIKATFKDAENVNHDLTKTIIFTIINKEEVRTSIDLTNLSQHTITKVTNPNGIDVTDEFMHMINNKTNAMLIKYDEIMEKSKALQVSAGKLLFTIDYLISDGIYPNRTLQVQFTLNDEKPVINCSLEIGESTTKEFNISFNPGIIFEQIGESYIYINDEIAYTINASSPTEVVKITRSYKENGDGDYYIKLVGTSGNVWQSFKVEIKEPLNTSAIIIIVVVVAVVATVVITIIVLRRKMRIR